VFDWDDTLIPSTYLAQKGYRLDGLHAPDPAVEERLRVLEESVCRTIDIALSYGRVHIVTNAEEGWVQMSAAKFMPRVVPWLAKVTITSARSTYEEEHPAKPLHWKVCAMEARLRESFEEPHSVKNILSLGDSHVEREAVKIAAQIISDPSSGLRTKSIKFTERPSVEQLNRQLELVHSCFASLQSYEGDLDLMLQITPDQTPDATPPPQQQQPAEANPVAPMQA